MEAIFAILLAFAATFATVPGYRLMWGWFATPVFGVPVPSFVMMAGLTLFVSLFTAHNNVKEESSLEVLVHGVLLRIVFVWLIVGFGYVFHLFV